MVSVIGAQHQFKRYFIYIMVLGNIVVMIVW